MGAKSSYDGLVPVSVHNLVSLLFVVLGLGCRSCYGFGTFGFDIHHRFSDPVKGILGFDEVPEKGSVDYYRVLVHGDHLIRGRHLASDDQTTPLTFSYGNDTDQLGGPFG
ncbi:Aspartic peptidase [Trema orientale]|uniref:Aspartic peptidase n=1 Tax=Trema orientale TaxID=63057 RepID=A0A2P5FSQ0_TREOI|nr:Aspartic peptidase [Trema orientale]